MSRTVIARKSHLETRTATDDEMTTATIDDLFDKDRLPTGWLLFLMLLYFPFGLVLALIRFFIGVHTFLVACLLPKTVSMRSYLLRAMCFVLGFVINEEGTKHKNCRAKVIVTNHVTALDHLAVDLVLPCAVPSVWDLPKVLTWCFGYKDFGVKQGRDVLINNVRKHCKESDLPILAHPEGATTNGRVGLLKFGVWPFCVGEPVLPVVIEVRRFYLLNVALSLIGSRWWSDLFWFLFSPCTIFTIRYLPEMQCSDGASKEEFADSVREAMVSSLRLHATNYTCTDKVEHLKRLLFRPVPPPSPSQSPSRAGTGSHGDTALAVMASQVKEVLPYVPIDVIKRDLVRTNSVSLTISNILEGTVHYIPETQEMSISSSSHQCVPPVAVANSDGQARPASNQLYTSLNMAASSFGKTANERIMSYQERKKRLIETARRTYIEKHGLS